MLKTKTLSKLKKALSKEPVSLAYLYGSYARNENHQKSDIDIAVLLEKRADKDFLDITSNLQKLLPQKKIDVRELHPKSSPLFAMNVITESSPLFVKDEQERVNVEVEIMRRFYRNAKIRRINNFYLQKSLKENTYGYPSTNY